MRMSVLKILILFTSAFIFSTQAIGTDIFRLIDPEYGGRYGKSPSDGPPFLRFGSAQEYFHTSEEYDDDSTAVSNVFSNWNSAGTVQFSSSQSSGLSIETFWDDYGNNQPPYIVNPGLAYPDHEDFIINTDDSWVQINTYHQWGTVQDLQDDMIDLETILVHEVGHIHGLAHPLTSSYTHNA